MSEGPSSPRPLPTVQSGPSSLRELLQEAGIRIASDAIRESLASLTCERNREQATGVMLEQLARQGVRLDGINVPRLEFERRLTLASRAIEAAGVHPDEVVRVALGVCAHRLLVEGEPAGIPGLEAVDLLGQLTPVDYALLDVSIGAEVLVYDKSPARPVVGDAPPGVVNDGPPELPPNVRMPEDLLQVLRAHFTDLSVEQVRQASYRLRRLGLYMPEHVYGQPSAAGREVLRLSKGIG